MKIGTLLATLALCAVAALPLSADATRKRHVGHYAVMMNWNDDTAGLTRTAQTVGITGITKRYTWRQLEPTPGNYQLQMIKNDLDLMASYGLYLVVMIEDKSFAVSKPTLPDYLLPYAGLNSFGGVTVARWDPFVVDRYKRLMTAIANQVGNHPNLEGIATTESAPSTSGTVLNNLGYTPEKYRDAYISMFKHIGTVMPTVRIFWYANYIPGGQEYIDDVIYATKTYGIVMGCPDVWPENDSLKKVLYPYFTQLRWNVPLMAQVEHVNYTQRHSDGSYYTALELFNFGDSVLRLDYIFWVNEVNEGNIPDFDSAKPVIENNPPPFNPLP